MAYQVSELYKNAIDSLSRTTKVTGALKTKSGVVINIENEKIDAGSLYITNQCVNGDAFQYGSVFAAELGITLKTDIDKYSLYDAEINLDFSILLENNEYETIPLGVFYVNEPKRVGKNVSIKAYDGMIKLDEDIVESTEGSPYDLLELISERCDVELSQTEEEIKALINGDKIFNVDQEAISTYRELLSYLCLMTCTFAIFDRSGKLKLISFKDDVSKNIYSKNRSTSSFSDFETYFSKIEANFLVSGSYESYTNEVEGTGLTYNMGDVPITQGLPESNQEALDLIFNELQKVRYVPCDIVFNGDPAVELGDKIINIDRFGNEFVSLVTFFKWTYRGRHQLKSAGSNPKLPSSKNNSSKELSKLSAEVAKKSVATYTYTNAKDYKIKGGEVLNSENIIRISFGANDDVNSIFMATINFTMDLDGFVELNMYLNSELVNTICKYCLQGNNVLTFMHYIPSETGNVYNFVVSARTYANTFSNARVSDASIKTNNNAIEAIITSYRNMASKIGSASSLPITGLDTNIIYEVERPVATVPVMDIAQFNIKAVIFGQGLIGNIKWDGTISIEDEFVSEEIAVVIGEIFNDNMTLKTIAPYRNVFSEAFMSVPIGVVDTDIFETNITFSRKIENYTFDTLKKSKYEYDRDFVQDTASFRLKTTYVYSSVENQIDSGKMCTVSIITSDKSSIEGIFVE